MTDKDFMDVGFRKFPPTRFDSNGIEVCFQKRYDDDRGKKYFITVNKWRDMVYHHTNETLPSSYNYSVQLYKKNGHEPLDLLFHSDWSLQDVEAYVEALWQTGLFEYYEEF